VPSTAQLALPRRGEIWLADLDGDKVRPVVILTRTAVIRHLHSVVAAPVTSTIRSIPTELPLSRAEGLLHDSVANFDNVQLVPRRWLIRRIGGLGERKLAAACDALAYAAGCSERRG
jgi:mRNA interferase MazF